MRIVRLLVNVHVVVNTKHFLLHPLEFDVKKVELNRTRKHKRSILSYNHLHLQQGIIHILPKIPVRFSQTAVDFEELAC